jgi:nitrogen fixation/metabolism regulation signal transduction histidine kinase
MTQSGYLFLGLTVIVGALAAVLAYAVLRIFAAAKSVSREQRAEGAETAFMASAMEDALKTLRTQERAMKARAEASERLSDEIISSMTSGLLVVSNRGEVRTLNPAGRRLLGLSVDDEVGGLREVLRYAPSLAGIIEECATTGRAIVRRAIPLTPGAPGATHIGVTASPVRDDKGHAHGAICLFTDLSEIVELEEQLRLKDSLARLGELTAGIAHEFRNGLATIHGYSRLLDPARLPGEFKPYVQGIRDEADALGEVVTNFLNFARPTELALAPVDMQAIAERAADEIRSEVTVRGGSVEVRGEFAPVEGDEVLLRQAFSNLCRNALEACAGQHNAPIVVIEGHVDGPQRTSRIEVTDNGPGIDPAAAPRIFRPFFSTKARGTGLGLALVQKIIVTHNGRVIASNQSEGGARFTVTLPLQPETSMHPAPEPASGSRNPR